MKPNSSLSTIEDYCISVESKTWPLFGASKVWLSKFQNSYWLKSIKVCEIHGKEKTGWTYLNDHMFKNNSPLEVRNFDYHTGGTLPNLTPSHAINYHRFSKYGAWKDSKAFYNLFDGGQNIVDFYANRKNQCEGWWPIELIFFQPKPSIFWKFFKNPSLLKNIVTII